MIRVWTNGISAGVLDRYQAQGSAFAYDRETAPELAISLTMPVRTASWNTSFGLAPIFEMNLPEGALRERLRLAFAKATGSFDELDLLAITGRSQLGRLRYTGTNDTLEEEVPFQSVDELLSSHRGGELYRYLIERFATFSGISGVQPKFLIRDERTFGLGEHGARELSHAFRGATHIVKFWDPSEFPQLAANEFFCLKAALACGLSVSPFRLTEDGSALVIERFDLRPSGAYLGFEDFCVLNGKRTDQKYSGSYETRVMRRFQEFGRSNTTPQESLQLFTLIVLNCALRNGDAHLKNFGVLYDDVMGEAHLAPAYDLVTTTAYLPKDRMALTLDGTNEWPSGKKLMRFAEAKSLGSPRELRGVLERVADALSTLSTEIEVYRTEYSSFQEVGGRMLSEWEIGRHSLKV